MSLNEPHDASVGQPKAHHCPPAGLPEGGLDPRAILNSIGEVIYDWDLCSDAVRWGANIRDVLGLASTDCVATGRALAELVATESPTTRYEAVMAAQETEPDKGAPYHAQYGLVLPDPGSRGDKHSRIWLEDTGRVFMGPDGKPLRAHGIVRVMTERFEASRQLMFRSVFDPLTGALNRTSLVEHISRLFKQGESKQRSFACLLVGVRGLARINHHYGYDVGDEMISGLVGRLRGNLRTQDVVGRYSGNKFALVLGNCDGEQMVEAAKRLVDTVARDPVATSAGPIPVTVRIGGILAPRHGRNAQIVLQHAEEALEATREAGKPPFVAYLPSLARDDARLRALRITDQVLSALNDRRIVLAFQPIVAAASGKPVWSEALMRLRDTDGSLVSPSCILPVAGKAGLVQMIDQRVLELSVAQMVQNPGLRLAFNVSALTAHDPAWPDVVRATLAMAPGVAQRLTVEISETAAVDNLDATRRAIDAMRKLGVTVAMDDFGAGHTSFRNLRNLRFDMLKIDGAFMQNLSRSVDDRLFVRTLVDLARHLGIPTVAEWVEDAETAKILADWGVDFLQGHYFGRAEVPADVLPAARAAG